MTKPGNWPIRFEKELEKRKLELWYKHMRGEKLTEDEIKEYGKLIGIL